MGVSVTTYCRRCGVEAPVVGDHGYVGAPVLAPGRRHQGLMPFGSIYQGLAGLRMLTAELVAFKAFLEAHTGHPLVQSYDDGEIDFGGSDEDDHQEPARVKPFRHRQGRVVVAFYELNCSACSARFRSNGPELLPPFEPFSPTTADIAAFANHVPEADDESFHRVSFPFDQLDELAGFLKKHKGHALQGRLDEAEPSAPPPGPQRAAKRKSPEAPVWASEGHEEWLGPVSPATEVRLAALHHFDPGRRAQACLSVAQTAEVGALGYLVELLRDPDTSVRLAATHAVAIIDDSRGVRALGRALLDDSAAVRQAAGDGLAARGVAADEALHQARELRGPYREVGVKRPKVAPSEKAILGALRDPRGSIRGAAADALEKKRREPWSGRLVTLLAIDPASGLRGRAAELLAASRDARSLGLLCALAADHNAWTAARAVQALGARGAIEAVEPLVEAAGRTDARVAAAAAQALGALGRPEAVPALANALENAAAPSVREAAARSLGQIGGVAAATALVAHLEHTSEDDRRYACWGLGDLPGPEAIHGLVACLRDRSNHVRREAARALALRNDAAGDRALLAAAQRGDVEVAGEAWRLLIAVGDAATEATLAAALTYDSPPQMVGALLCCGNRSLARAARQVMAGRRLGKPDRRAVKWGEHGGLS